MADSDHPTHGHGQDGFVSEAKMAPVPPKSLSWTVGLLGDTVACYLLLCLICELPNRIFFPALVVMGFSGLEPLLGVHLLSVLLGSDRIWRLCVRGSGLLIMLSLPAFYWYGALENHYERTTYIGAAIVAVTLAVQAPMFFNRERCERLLWAQQLAVAFLLCLRYAFKSALPTWSYHRGALPAWAREAEWSFQAPECDKWTAVVGLVAAVILLLEYRGQPDKPVRVGFGRWFLAALALASNMFMTFWLFTCHSVIPRWVGVDPTQYGPGVIVAYMVGALLSLRPSLAGKVIGAVLGPTGAYMLYYGDETYGYAGGLLVAVFTSASWTTTFSAVFKCAGVKGRMLFISQLAYVFLEFTTVWNIAYMFLDLGDAFREAPHYPLFFSVGVLAVNNLTTATSRVPGRRISGLAIAVLFALMLGTSLYVRVSFAVTRPHQVETKENELKVMIWNVHTGYADNGYDNYELAATFLQDMQAGVVAILENDQARPCTGNRDQIEYLGASLGFPYHNYGVKTRDSTWGCAFISLYPIKESNVTVLPSPYGTRSCLIDAVLNVNGKDFNLVVSHFSTEEFPEDLKLQTKALSSRTMTKNDMPLSVLCYITSAPDSATWKKAEDRANYHTLVTVGTLKDPDPTDFDRWCQYIFYKNTQVKQYYHVDTGYMSDTEAQLAVISTEFNATSEPVTAEFYKYFIEQRTLKHWYTGARHRNQRPPIAPTS